MRSPLSSVVVVGLFVACTGCSSEDTGGGTSGTDGGTSATTVAPYSCISSTGNCLDFQGSAYLDSRRSDLERKACTDSKGTSQSTPCTATGRIGRCIQRSGTATQGVINYYAGSATTLESNCTAGGDTWQGG